MISELFFTFHYIEAPTLDRNKQAYFCAHLNGAFTFHSKALLLLRVNICIRRVFLNKFAPWGYFFSHKHCKCRIGFKGVFYRYLLQCTVFRIHCCIPQLMVVHFSQTFIPLSMHLRLISSRVIINKNLTLDRKSVV